MLDLVAIAPTGFAIIVSDAAEFADDDRLASILEALGKGGAVQVVEHFSFQNFLAVLLIPFQQHAALFLIVMQGNDVGHRVFPAIVDDYRTHGVQGFGQVINGLGKVLLRRAGFHLGNAPGLIHPGSR